MRVSFACFVLVLVGSAFGAEPENDRVKKLLTSNNYTVTWGEPATYDTTAELVIGDGNGHGNTLGWLRFLPDKTGVDVLSIQFKGDREPVETKWPPDVAPVVVKSARMKSDTYITLLGDLAVVDAAKLQENKTAERKMSFDDFWAHLQITANKKTLSECDWAGYRSSLYEIDYAKPHAAVTLAREAVKGLDFKEHTLTDPERTWISAKFTRDWKKFQGKLSHWWVRENYLMIVGVAGDATALPTLRDILNDDPKERNVYYAINAITRLLKKDVREQPVEKMDIKKTREKVLELLRNVK